MEITVALIGVGGALFGALIGGIVSDRTTREQFQEQRSTAARAQRADVYKRLLASSADIRSEKAVLNFRCGARSVAAPRSWTELRTGLCVIKFGRRLRSAEARYRRAADGVFVYGSDRAYTAERRLARLIISEPRKAWIFTRGYTRGRVIQMDIRTFVDDTKFNHAYGAFQRVMCRELSAQPRHGCS